MVRLTDSPDMTLDVYPGRKTATTGESHSILQNACSLFQDSNTKIKTHKSDLKFVCVCGKKDVCNLSHLDKITFMKDCLYSIRSKCMDTINISVMGQFCLQLSEYEMFLNNFGHIVQRPIRLHLWANLI